MTAERYDRWQFDGKKTKAVSAETRIAWSDYNNGLHIQHHNGLCPSVPPFALNDEKLRLALAQMVFDYSVWHRGHGRQRVPEHLVKNIDELIRMADRRTAEIEQRKLERGSAEQEIQYRHFDSCKTAGSYFHRQANVAYLSWRCHMNSPAVAMHLRENGVYVTPQLVRMILNRLRVVGNWLFGPEESPRFKDHRTHRGFRSNHHNRKLPMSAELLKLCETKTYREIGQQFGVKAAVVQKAFQRAGGIRAPRVPRRWTPELIQRITALRGIGFPWEGVQQELGYQGKLISLQYQYWQKKKAAPKGGQVEAAA